MRRYVGFDMDSARWDGFVLREGDIVISSPMKAGTTWTQTICALLVFGRVDFPAPLSELSPWLDMETRPIGEVLAALDRQEHRRFVKTHTPLDGLPIDPRVTYIGVGRHPLDLVLSAARHSANVDVDSTLGRVAATVGEEEALRRLSGRPVPSHEPNHRLEFFLTRDDPPEVALTLAGVMAHYRTYFESGGTVVRLHFSDLVHDRDAAMREVAGALDITVDDETWPALVEAAGLPAMRRRAEELVPGRGLGLVRDPRAFFGRGAHGEWRERIPAPVHARFEDRLAELDPDGAVAAWAVAGMVGAA